MNIENQNLSRRYRVKKGDRYHPDHVKFVIRSHLAQNQEFKPGKFYLVKDIGPFEVLRESKVFQK